MRYSGVDIVERLARGIEEYFDAHGLVWKHGDMPTEQYSAVRPYVYRMCIPYGETDRATGFPTASPSVLVTVDDMTSTGTEQSWHISVHTCVSDEARTASETVEWTGAFYRYLDGTDWEAPGAELYTHAYRLTEAALDAVDTIAADIADSLRISDRRMTPPDMLMSYYPYSAGLITFTVTGIPRPKGGYNDLL